MGAAGFWDDSERAAAVSAEHARASRRLETFSALQRGRRGPRRPRGDGRRGRVAAGRRSTSRSPRSRSAWPSSRSSGCSPGATTPATRSCSVNAGAGGTDAQDWAEMVLRMEMRWARAARLRRSSCWRRAPARKRASSRPRSAPRGENAYGLFGAERGVHRLVRLSPFDSAHRRQTSFAGVEVAPVVRGHRRDRDQRGRPAGRHLPRLRRGRAARQQDRLGGAHHPPAHGHRRAVPERALAVLQPRDRDGDAAREAARAQRARTRRRRSRARRARRRTSTSARRSAPTCCTRTRWSRTTARATRWATCSACSTATSTGSCARTLLRRTASSGGVGGGRSSARARRARRSQEDVGAGDVTTRRDRRRATRARAGADHAEGARRDLRAGAGRARVRAARPERAHRAARARRAAGARRAGRCCRSRGARGRCSRRERTALNFLGAPVGRGHDGRARGPRVRGHGREGARHAQDDPRACARWRRPRWRPGGARNHRAGCMTRS